VRDQLLTVSGRVIISGRPQMLFERCTSGRIIMGIIEKVAASLDHYRGTRTTHRAEEPVPGQDGLEQISWMPHFHKITLIAAISASTVTTSASCP
jgi:hypothetical protein